MSSVQQIPPHYRKLLLKEMEKGRKRNFALPIGIFFLCLFCCWLIYRSLHPLLPLPNEPPRLYSNQCQTDLRLLFTRAIESSQKSIHLVMFGLTDLAVLRTIRERMQAGVSAEVYYDPKASIRIPNKLRGALLHPVQMTGLMHQKILVLDGDLVFLGSANMTAASLRMHDNLVIGMRSPSVARFLAEHPPYTSGYLRTMVGGQDVELWLLPDPRGHVINELRRCIRNASRSLKIALFTFTHPGLCEELIDAKRRGVAVSVIIDQHSARGASMKTVGQLRDAGVPVLLSQGVQLLHHKFLLVDDRTLVCGSANWTKAAFCKNSDCILLLHCLTDEQQRFMKSLWHRVAHEATELAQKKAGSY